MRDALQRSLAVCALVTAIAATVLWPHAQPTPASAPPPPGSYELLAWNEVGVHGMDAHYGVFSLWPPSNSIEAQLLVPGGDRLTAPNGITLTYEAVASPSGSVNATSANKTDFWAHAPGLYGGSNVPDEGLLGFDMPGSTNAPQTMVWDATARLFRARGIPVTPRDDLGRTRPYPMMRVVARDATGAVLAETQVVLPVSDETDCALCHASEADPLARPATGWVHDPHPDRDPRLNILRLHDEQHLGSPAFAAAASARGYASAGLEATATSGQSVLCSACHGSEAFPGSGYGTITALTSAMHGGHATVVDPRNGQTLDASAHRSACQACHPGEETSCLRGAMGQAVDAAGQRAMHCQSCHGSLSEVGDPARTGWLDQPRCQSCHTGSATQNAGQIRHTSAFTATGAPRQPVLPLFATDPDTPSAGHSLFRFSRGHGELPCSACHGPAHATRPSAQENDAAVAIAHQGHRGTIMECASCHGIEPTSINGGPHGMHPSSQWFVDRAHGDWALLMGAAECRACHGGNDLGTALSTAQTTRSWSTPYGTVTFTRGQRVSCYACHDGPTTEVPVQNTWPTVTAPQGLVAGSQPLVVPLTVNDPDGPQVPTLRIARQPAHATVELVGQDALVRAQPGHAGADSFSVVAFDGYTEGLPLEVTITIGASVRSYGRAYPPGGPNPLLSLDQAPALGTNRVLQLTSSTGAPGTALLLLGTERARTPTLFGGRVLVHDPMMVPFPVGVPGSILPLALPPVPALNGFRVCLQLVQADPQARFFISFSSGLELFLGP